MMEEDAPAAVVIDMERQPSAGRDLAIQLRCRRGTRHIPIVVLGGKADKVRRLQEILPDATFAAWCEAQDAIRRAIATQPAEPVVPESVFAAYAGIPLVQKLGIAPEHTVAVVGAPKGWEHQVGTMPDGAKFTRDCCARRDLTLWFVRERAELEGGLRAMLPHAEGGRLWIIWPKKSSGVQSDLTQKIVRAQGLASGLVDFKVCSLDATWTGLRFSRRS
jgi:hypothetical protein